MKKSVPVWAWIVMSILAILVIILLIINYYSVSLEEYQIIANYYADSVLEYGELGSDYLNLLNCYREGLPTCEPLNQKYGNASLFTLG